jgi:hypothetical protein
VQEVTDLGDGIVRVTNDEREVECRDSSTRSSTRDDIEEVECRSLPADSRRGEEDDEKEVECRGWKAG